MTIAFYEFETLPSTNEWVKERLAHLHLPACVVANTQTAGRGRYSRQWYSPPGGLYLTLVWHSELLPDPILLTRLLAEKLLSLFAPYKIPLTIKWPNDLFLHGKKVAGILCETLAREHSHFILIGLGLNLYTSHRALDDVGQPATTLIDYAIDRTALLEELCAFVLSLNVSSNLNFGFLCSSECRNHCKVRPELGL